MPRTAPDKLALFRRRFRGLTEAYGTFDLRTWRGWQVKGPVTDKVILDHLRGRRPLGLYLLQQDRTHTLAVDFDEEDANPPLAFMEQCGHYDLPAYLERSKRRGWHVWLFFAAAGVPAYKPRRVASMILEEVDQPGVEVFPKQDALRPGEYGNFIYLPLFGRLVRRGRTVFVDPANGLAPYPDQWALLQHIRSIEETQLDELIEINGLQAPTAPEPAPAEHPVSGRTFGLPPCIQRMLEQGATRLQRVSCFRLAVQLKKAGLPEAMAVAVLDAWSQRNRPEDGRPIITAEEIREQTGWAYRRPYRAIGCHDPAVRAFHGPDCPCVRWPSRRGSDAHACQQSPSQPS